MYSSTLVLYLVLIRINFEGTDVFVSAYGIVWSAPGDVCVCQNHHIVLKWTFTQSSQEPIKGFTFCYNKHHSSEMCEKHLLAGSYTNTDEIDVLDPLYQGRLEFVGDVKLNKIAVKIKDVRKDDIGTYAVALAGIHDRSNINTDCNLQVVKGFDDISIRIRTFNGTLATYNNMDSGEGYMVDVTYEGELGNQSADVMLYVGNKAIKQRHCYPFHCLFYNVRVGEGSVDIKATVSICGSCTKTTITTVHGVATMAKQLPIKSSSSSESISHMNLAVSCLTFIVLSVVCVVEVYKCATPCKKDLAKGNPSEIRRLKKKENIKLKPTTDSL